MSRGEGLRAAAAFLTRVPVATTASTPRDLARSTVLFPVVGGLVGLAVAAAYGAARLALPPLVAAVIAVAIGVVATGALHEDGLADTADALGGRNRADALRILRDPTHGTYGMVALVLSLMVRTGALAALDGWTALAALPGAHALGRTAAVGLLGTLPAARDDGLAAAYASTVAMPHVGAAAFTGLAVGAAMLGAWVVPAALLTLGATAAIGWLARRRFGGMTGDVVGAAEQLGEIVVMVLAVAVVRGDGPGLPWWR